jgi:hypothetical protein
MATSSSPKNIAASRTLQVVKVAGGVWRANEPSGFTAHPPLDFNNTLTNTSGWVGYDVGNLQYVTDFNAPSPGDNVGRLIYPATAGGGGAFVNIGSINDEFTKKSVYYCIGLKMSANFQYHLTGTNKVFFINVAGYGGGGDPFFVNIDSDTNPARFNAVLQGNLSRVFPKESGAEMLKGEWYVIEGRLGMNSAGNADGTFEQWVRRVSNNATVKTHDYSDVQYVDSIYAFGLPKLQPTWGGGGDTVVNEFYLDVSELYVSWSET